MIKIRRKIKKLLYGKCPGFRGSFPYYGMKVYFPKGSELFYRTCEEGVYEQSIVNILNHLVKGNTYFFDVGANIGLISVPILKNNNLHHCISFEPSPNSLPFLIKTAKESGFAQRWEIIGKAVGAVCGESDFHLSSSACGAFEGFKSTGRVPVKKIVKIPVTSIDHEWILRGRPAVSAIKVDVEGAEIDVINGARNCIASQKPYIIIEWNESNFRTYGNLYEDLITIANEIGYVIYSLPNIVKINDATDLKVQMFFSENFLLCPR